MTAATGAHRRWAYLQFVSAAWVSTPRNTAALRFRPPYEEGNAACARARRVGRNGQMPQMSEMAKCRTNRLQGRMTECPCPPMVESAAPRSFVHCAPWTFPASSLHWSIRSSPFRSFVTFRHCAARLDVMSLDGMRHIRRFKRGAFVRAQRHRHARDRVVQVRHSCGADDWRDDAGA